MYELKKNVFVAFPVTCVQAYGCGIKRCIVQIFLIGYLILLRPILVAFFVIVR